MAERLTNEQEYELVDFLKRWGIDHPELLAEMTDHYTEMALESMASGISWDRVLDSWKTKETFRGLRKIQKAYENQHPRIWCKIQWETGKEVLFDNRTLLLLAGMPVLFWLDSKFDLQALWCILVLMKFAAAYGLVIYFKLNKRYRSIFTFKDFGVFSAFYGAMVFVCFEHLFLLLNKFEGNAVPTEVSLIFLGFSTLVDLFGYKLLKRTVHDTRHLTDQMLQEYIPKPYQQKKE